MDSWEISEMTDEPKVVDESIFFNEISFVESEVFANDSNEKHVTISHRNYAMDSNVASLALAAASHRNFGFHKPNLSLVNPHFESAGKSFRTIEVVPRLETDIENGKEEPLPTAVNVSSKNLDCKRYQEKHLECPTFTTHCSYDPAMLNHIVCVIVALVYNGFLIGALLYAVEKTQQPIDWHNGVGFLVIVTAFVYFIFLYKFLAKRVLSGLYLSIQEWTQTFPARPDSRWVGWMGAFLVIGVLITLLSLDATIISVSENGVDRQKFVSILGIGFVIVLGALMSKKPSGINWRIVVSCCLVSFIFCFAMMRSSVFAGFVQTIFNKGFQFASFSRAGSKYLFGSLIDGKSVMKNNKSGETLSFSSDFNDMFLVYLPSYFFHTLTTIYFTNLAFTILRIYKVVPWMIGQIGFLARVFVGTSGVESLYSIARIFFEQSSSPVLIKDSLNDLTESELNTILTISLSGTASLITLYDLPDKEFSNHFVTASAMSVLSAIVVSKLIWPEVSKEIKDSPSNFVSKPGSMDNKFDCVLKSFGTSNEIIFTSSGLAIGLLGTISFFDAILHWAGSLYGLDSLSLAVIGEHIFQPVMWSIGVNWSETDIVSRLFTYKITRTDMTALSFLDHTIMNKRSKVLSVYLLFNNVHPLGLALTVGTFHTLLSEDLSMLRKCLPRSLLGSLMANFLATAIVNTFVDG